MNGWYLTKKEDDITKNKIEYAPVQMARFAGFLYLMIIVFGIWAEVGVRSGMVVPGDAEITADNIAASPGLFRAGFMADSIMVLCDVGLAVLLYLLLKPVGLVLSLTAMCFRLAQAVVLALNLLNYYGAMLFLNSPGHAAVFETNQLNTMAAFYLNLHSHGYDLGLLFFGVHCLLLGYLIFNSRYIPRILGILAMGAGCVYLVGTYTRFLFPDYSATVAPIYLVAVISEVSLCVWLLVKGVRSQLWPQTIHRYDTPLTS
jgi:hypothetical protein